MSAFRMSTLTFKQRRLLLLSVGLVLVLGVIYFSRAGMQKHLYARRVEVPPESLKMTTEQEEELWKGYKLKPIKSRGATIFLDDSGNIRIPPMSTLQLMTLRDLEELYDRYVGTIQTICKQKVHFGMIPDGGYDMCQDEEVVPTAPCLMYSFGVRTDFSFDEEVATMYGCEIHSFDPSNGMKDHKHSENMYFHSLGISNFNGVMNKDWNMRTFSTMKKELGHTQRKVEIVKIDVESAEWVSFASMLNDGMFKDIKQLITELHTWVDLPPLIEIYQRSEEQYRHNLDILRQIYDEGFRIFFLRRFGGRCCIFTDNFGIERTGCNEVHFMRVK